MLFGRFGLRSYKYAERREDGEDLGAARPDKGRAGRCQGKDSKIPEIKAPRDKPAMKIEAAKVQEKVQWAGQASPNQPEEAPTVNNLRSSPAHGGI